MNKCVTGLMLSACMLAGGPAVAQQASKADSNEDKVQARPAKMYEDIEILRRLLIAKLQPFQQSTISQAAYEAAVRTWETRTGKRFQNYGLPRQGQTGTGQAQVTPAFTLNLEGIYLKGHGVLFSVTLPPPGQDPTADSGGKKSRPLSDWERMRKEVRHEKIEPVARDSRPKGPSLAEVVLKVLADNGHHVGQLQANETVTIVITFRAPAQQLAPQNLTTWRLIQLGYVAPSTNQSQPVTSSNTASPNRNTGDSSARSYELLGDLHLKQGKPAEAIKAYQRVMEFKPKPKHLASLFRKVAQAYLALGQDEQARRLLEQAVTYSKQASGAKDKPQAKALPELPAKLTISVPKKLLDQVGASKISFAEFKKGATVNYLTFRAAAK